jgi:hypothetical protein
VEERDVQVSLKKELTMSTEPKPTSLKSLYAALKAHYLSNEVEEKAADDRISALKGKLAAQEIDTISALESQYRSPMLGLTAGMQHTLEQVMGWGGVAQKAATKPTASGSDGKPLVVQIEQPKKGYPEMDRSELAEAYAKEQPTKPALLTAIKAKFGQLKLVGYKTEKVGDTRKRVFDLPATLEQIGRFEQGKTLRDEKDGGAVRYTTIEKFLEEVSFIAPFTGGKKLTVEDDGEVVGTGITWPLTDRRDIAGQRHVPMRLLFAHVVEMGAQFQTVRPQTPIDIARFAADLQGEQIAPFLQPPWRAFERLVEESDIIISQAVSRLLGKEEPRTNPFDRGGSTATGAMLEGGTRGVSLEELGAQKEDRPVVDTTRWDSRKEMDFCQVVNSLYPSWSALEQAFASCFDGAYLSHHAPEGVPMEHVVFELVTKYLAPRNKCERFARFILASDRSQNAKLQVFARKYGYIQ